MRGVDKSGAAATIGDPIIDDCMLSGNSSERCAIFSLRSIHSAQITYQSTTGGGLYATFPQLLNAGLLRQGLASGTAHGYVFSCTTIPSTAATSAFFKVTATPQNYGMTGRRSFYIDVDGVLRGADKNGASADENDPPIEDYSKLRVD